APPRSSPASTPTSRRASTDRGRGGKARRRRRFRAAPRGRGGPRARRGPRGPRPPAATAAGPAPAGARRYGGTAASSGMRAAPGSGRARARRWRRRRVACRPSWELQGRTGLGDVGADLRHQRIHGGETLLAAQPGDEGDAQTPAVEVPVEAEEVGLERGG